MSTKQKDAVILAGGKGNRLKKILNLYPKSLAKFNNKFLINYIINFLAKYDINRIFILTGHKSFLIHRHLDNKFKNFVEIKCIKEKKIMGTGGALYNLKNKKLNDFYLLNGDTIFEIDLIFQVISHKIS